MSKFEGKILFTGGHSTPAFAVLDALLERRATDDRKLTTDNLIWVSEKYNQRGTKEPSAEYKIVNEKYKIKFIDIHAGKLVRKWTLSTFVGGLLELINLFVGFIQAFFIILKYHPKMIMSFGGFLAVPIVFWGRILGARVITHEQTIVTGLANRIIGKFAHKILISFQESKKYFDESKVTFTGNPIRKDVFKINSNITKDFSRTKPIIYITGGNQGAHEINKRVFEIIEELVEMANVIHQTGSSTLTNDFMTAQKLITHSPNLKTHYIVRDYIGPEEIGEVMNKADLVVSRSGANTVTEIMALGKLAILIPIPWTSHDEQTKNAKLLENLGLGFRLVQSDNLTSSKLLDAIRFGLNNRNKSLGFNGKKLSECAKDAKQQVRLDAAEKIVDVIQSLFLISIS